MNNNAVIYARYSSDKQTEQSIEAQVLECTAFAKSQNLKIIDTYIDRAFTGRNDNRTEFQRMLRDSKKKLFQFVLVYQFDRFARNRYDSATNKNILKKNGVKVLSAKERITDDPAGILLESVLEGYAEFFSADLSQKVKSNQKLNIAAGNFCGGYIPYGYKIIDKKYIIDPVTSKIVIQIFDRYANGFTIESIKKELDSQGIKNNLGKPFVKNTLLYILNNKKYIGTLMCEGVEIENIIPAIVSKDVFQKVETKMKKNKEYKGGTRAKESYLLSGKLFCGECETLMFGESGTNRLGKIYNYYKCNKQKKNLKSCAKKTISKEFLEKFIIKATIDHILQDDILKQAAQEVYLFNQKERQDKTDIIRLDKQLKDINKSLAGILKAIEQGIITDTTKERLIELENEKAIVESSLKIKQLGEEELSENKILFWFQQFKNSDTEDVDFQARLIDTFINKIFLFDDKVIILYNVRGGKEKLELNLTEFNKQIQGSSVRLLTHSGSQLKKALRLFYFAIY